MVPSNSGTMSPQELDDLVRQIGDEILLRLSPGTAAPQAVVSSCGCDHGGSTVAAAGSSIPPASAWTPPEGGIVRFIDHTLLRPEATAADIERLCDEARQWGFAAVCVQPCHVARAARLLHGTPIEIGTVIGFPHGSTLTPVKREEASQALKLGATELDMVVALGALKAGDLDFVYQDIHAVTVLAHRRGAAVKVILETALLTYDEKMRGCVAAKLAGADFVKTSTGFGSAGADAGDVALMRRVVGAETGVKAAGGIRTYEQFRVMMAAGASRVGTSASVAIARESAAAVVSRS